MDSNATTKALGFLCAAFVLAAGGCSRPPQANGGPHILTEAPAPIFDFPNECPPSAGMDACRAKLDAFPVAFGTERDRAPSSGNKKPRVLIIAFQGTKDISASSPPSSPTLILHLANHGKVNTLLYDLDPQSQADYYVTVKSDAGKGMWTLWRVPANNNGSVTSVATGPFGQCQPPAPTQWAYSIADFASCVDAPHLQGVSHASIADFSIRPLLNLVAAFLPPPPGDSDGGWFSCDGGCCTMNTT
jgi:hypothetical protein